MAPLQVVGIRYYQGEVNMWEMVLLDRDRHNPYDKNAIQVRSLLAWLSAWWRPCQGHSRSAAVLAHKSVEENWVVGCSDDEGEMPLDVLVALISLVGSYGTDHFVGPSRVI